jgi:hypothetical protein
MTFSGRSHSPGPMPSVTPIASSANVMSGGASNLIGRYFPEDLETLVTIVRNTS